MGIGGNVTTTPATGNFFDDFDLGGLLKGGASYYLGSENIDAARQLGRETQEGAAALAAAAQEGSQFKPYTVTSGLANVGTTPEGGFNLNLSPEQQALQSGLLGGAQGLSGNLGGQYNPLAGQIGQQAYGQAQQQLGQATSYDPSLTAQRGAIGGIFGQQLGQYGQPTGMEGLTQAGLGGAMSQFGAAGQPADINQLRGQFANQVGGYLGQQPNTQLGQLSQQALGLGSQGLTGLTAPSDIEALRSQYAGLAGQAGQGLLSSPEQRQSDIYESIRATQRPEEERASMRLQEQLLGQGRAGISTDAYGGTPEQLAMAKAQAEAGNSAALMARQQAMSEQQQAMANAQGLTGLASGLAGTSSDLQSAAQSRASQLSQLGLSAEQVQSQLQNEGLSRGVTAGSTAGQLAGIASDLESAGISRGATLSNVGLAGQQAGQQMSQQQLANLLSLQQADIGAAGAQQGLQQGNLALGSGLFGLGQQAALTPAQLQGADISNMQALMNAGYNPQQQALNLFGAGVPTAQIAQRGQLGGTELQSQATGQGIESYMQGANMANLLQQQQLQGMMSSAFGSQPTTNEQILNALLNKGSAPLQGSSGFVGDFINKGLGMLGLGGKNNDPTSAFLQALTGDQGVYTDGNEGYNPIPDSDRDGVNDLLDNYPNDPTKT